ncbi:hypothetical protein [Stenotrophomonas tuberculopleuritidis]|uniref:hypothetical protein n=1 Tax=Stenotrophomonas tuberculopleuritidis TaxID=3055079 RepID=UPI0026E59132|nr:hypothetical protein [Stenotrophomonas sp. 704A1]
MTANVHRLHPHAPTMHIHGSGLRSICNNGTSQHHDIATTCQAGCRLLRRHDVHIAQIASTAGLDDDSHSPNTFMNNRCVLQVQGRARTGEGDVGTRATADQCAVCDPYRAARTTGLYRIGIASFRGNRTAAQFHSATATDTYTVRTAAAGENVRMANAGNRTCNAHAMTGGTMRFDAYPVDLVRTVGAGEGNTCCIVAAGGDGSIGHVQAAAGAFHPDAGGAVAFGSQHHRVIGGDATTIENVEGMLVETGGGVAAAGRGFTGPIGHHLLGPGPRRKNQDASECNRERMPMRGSNAHAWSPESGRHAHRTADAPLSNPLQSRLRQDDAGGSAPHWRLNGIPTESARQARFATNCMGAALRRADTDAVQDTRSRRQHPSSHFLHKLQAYTSALRPRGAAVFM